MILKSKDPQTKADTIDHIYISLEMLDKKALEVLSDIFP